MLVNNIKRTAGGLFLLGLGLSVLSGCRSEGDDNPEKVEVEPVQSHWLKTDITSVTDGGLLSTNVVAVPDTFMPNLVHFIYLLDADDSEEGSPVYDMHHLIWDTDASQVHSSSVNENIVTLDNTLGFSVAIDINNTLYTAYRGGNEADCNSRQSDAMLSVKSANDTQWSEYLGGIGYSGSRNPVYQDGDAGDHTSIAVDSNGDVHMAFQFFWEGCDSNNALHPDVLYVRKTAGAFDSFQNTDEEQVEGNNYITNRQNAVGFHNSLILDENESPVVFYFARDTDDNHHGLRVAHRVNGTWQPEWVDRGCNIGDISAALSPNGNLGVAYNIELCTEFLSYTEDDEHALRYAEYDGENWTIYIVDEATHVGKHTSLAFNSLGEPAIAYYETTSFSTGSQSELYNLKLAQFDSESGQWFKERVTEAGDVGVYNTLWFDEEDNIFLSTFSNTDRKIILFSELEGEQNE